MTKQLEVWSAWSAAVQLLCRQPLARLASAEMRWPSAQEAFTVFATRLTAQAQRCALGLAQWPSAVVENHRPPSRFDRSLRNPQGM